MQNVGCGSSDTALLACSYNPNIPEENHVEDAGVKCGGECSTAIHTCTCCISNILLVIHFLKQLPALMEIFVWLVVVHAMKGQWRCVFMEDGVQCVMTYGV